MIERALRISVRAKFPAMAIKRGSSVDQVGLTPMSNVSPSDPNTGMRPIALPDGEMPVNRNDGGSRSIQPGVGQSAPAAKAWKANTGMENP